MPVRPVNVDGGDVPAERVLDHLKGHAASGPVRIGNAAAQQIQHDIIGPLLDATHVYERAGGVISLRLWREIRHLVDVAVERADLPQARARVKEERARAGSAAQDADWLRRAEAGSGQRGASHARRARRHQAAARGRA